MKINPDKLRRDDPEVAAKKAQLEKLLALDKEAKKSGAVLEPDLTLAEFMKKFWHVIEPATELKWGWYMDAICEHLEAVTTGKLRNLIINIPAKNVQIDPCCGDVACMVLDVPTSQTIPFQLLWCEYLGTR